MVECRYMEQPDFRPETSPAPTPSTPPEDSRDHVADVPTTSAHDAAASRHLYTMTVDDVSAELIAYDLHRDSRTIQRWCKSGKLRAMIDHEHGDRYLIDPASVRDMVTTLLEERDSRGPRHATPPRPDYTSAGTAPRHDDTAPTQFQFTPRYMADKERDNATEAATAAPTSEASRDEIATLKQTIAELEKEKAMLSVDKQVREHMVDYLKENFQKMLDQALDRTEQLGKLQAENAQLRALLPQHTERQPDQPDYRQSEAPTQPPPSMHNRTPWGSE